jgi:hypothetical protein
MEAQRPVDTMDPSDLHENVDSPRFRPAFGDLTNELTLESPGQLARKRKSLGRRVSFAAKAKVRYIITISLAINPLGIGLLKMKLMTATMIMAMITSL